MYWWAREYPVKDAADEANVDEKTAIQAYQYCRDICSWRLLNHDAPLMLGGQGVVVQIDESFVTSQNTTEDVQQLMRCGYLVCVTRVIHQLWA